MLSKALLVHFPPEVVAALAVEKSRTHEPTASFIRRAVTAALKLEPKTEQTAAPLEYRAPCVLVAAAQEYEPDFGADGGVNNDRAEQSDTAFKTFMDGARARRDEKLTPKAEENK